MGLADAGAHYNPQLLLQLLSSGYLPQLLPFLSHHATAPKWSAPLLYESICWPHSTGTVRSFTSSSSSIFAAWRCLAASASLVRVCPGLLWAPLGRLALPATTPLLHPPCRSLFTLQRPSQLNPSQSQIPDIRGRELWCSTKVISVVKYTALLFIFYLDFFNIYLLMRWLSLC